MGYDQDEAHRQQDAREAMIRMRDPRPRQTSPHPDPRGEAHPVHFRNTIQRALCGQGLRGFRVNDTTDEQAVTCVRCLKALMARYAEAVQHVEDLNDENPPRVSPRRPAELPPLDFGAPLWLFDDRVISAMLYDATSFVEDPANDADLNETAEAVRQHVDHQAALRGIGAQCLPPHDPTGEALYLALDAARLDMIAAWMAEPQVTAVASNFSDAVRLLGCPERITRATDALRAASPTA